MRDITNALTIDVEGFLESNRESFGITTGAPIDRREREEVRRNMDAVLALLDEAGTRATFFFVGTVARSLPQVVEEVAGSGHEVASHGSVHRRLYGLAPEEFRRDLADAKTQLEDLAGVPVTGFRAPDFSLTERSLWAVDVLHQAGFAYDSSVYPIGMHDVYGMPAAERFIFRWPNGLVELPLSTVEVLGRRIPFAGGGYFRLYPLALTGWWLDRLNREGHPAVFYLHPYELGPVIPRIRGLSPYRRFRHYYHWRQGGPRLRRLLSRFRFAPARTVLAETGLLDDGR
jgi:polysaccharide deacetylase family protein (PEP-CTERM system associated)